MKRYFLSFALVGTIGIGTFPGSANAATLYVAGAYFNTIDIEALIYKLTGNPDKTSTKVEALVGVVQSQSECTNPQFNLVTPGNGPAWTAVGSSPDLNSTNLFKDDRFKGNNYQTLASVTDLVPEASRITYNGCKDAPGASTWYQLAWRDKGCYPTVPSAGLKCYDDLAVIVPDYSQSPTVYKLYNFPSLTEIPTTDHWQWTFVYLPLVFDLDAKVLQTTNSGTNVVATWQGRCTMSADAYGVQYSLTNPPAAGWADARVPYNCVAF